MSDLIERSQAALAVDESLPKWARLDEMLQAYSGLELSRLDLDVRAGFEDGLMAVNDILAQYDLRPGQDYRLLSDTDLDEALYTMCQTATWATEEELDRIVAGLHDSKDSLPVAAIEETRRHRELMIPKLIDVLRNAADDARDGQIDGGSAALLAMYLLTEFHSPAGFQAILEAVRLPDDLPDNLFGDAITETLARILAEFHRDFPETLEELLANRDLNQYVRWEAAQTFAYLVRDGQMTRDQAIERLRHHLRIAIDQSDFDIISPLVCELSRFSAAEAAPEIGEAFERGFVETFLIGRRTAEQHLKLGPAAFQQSMDRSPPIGIKDTIAELRSWVGFSGAKPPTRPVDVRGAIPGEVSAIGDFPVLGEVSAPLSTALLTTRPHVGRNDPCPCGSGKKYKKCCLRSN